MIHLLRTFTSFRNNKTFYVYIFYYFWYRQLFA